MAGKNSGPRKPAGALDSKKLDEILARRHKGRDGRPFPGENLDELTVHHKDHNHDNNPPDGSNWENLCLYCHDNEHQRFAHLVRGYDVSIGVEKQASATHNPFANLKDMLKDK